jgi:hypothetical protein
LTKGHFLSTIGCSQVRQTILGKRQVACLKPFVLYPETEGGYFMINTWKSRWFWIFLLTGFLLCLFDGVFMDMGKGIAILAVSIMSANFLGSCFTISSRGERIVEFFAKKIIFPLAFIVAVIVGTFYIFADINNPWIKSVLSGGLGIVCLLGVVLSFLSGIRVVEDGSE